MQNIVEVRGSMWPVAVFWRKSGAFWEKQCGWGASWEWSKMRVKK